MGLFSRAFRPAAAGVPRHAAAADPTRWGETELRNAQAAQAATLQQLHDDAMAANVAPGSWLNAAADSYCGPARATSIKVPNYNSWTVAPTFVNERDKVVYDAIRYMEGCTKAEIACAASKALSAYILAEAMEIQLRGPSTAAEESA